MDRLSEWWYRVRGRLRDLPWRRILAGSALALAVTAAVPPLRRAANFAASRAVLFVISPFAPGSTPS